MKYLDLNIFEILENWDIWQALREFISNAIDEHKICQVKENIVCKYYDGGQVVIRDYGRGIKSENFIQSESIEKIERNDLIGKFGIGLKDAIAKLHREKIPLKIKSKHGIWQPTLKNKDGLSEKQTIHMAEFETNEPNFRGTEIIVQDIDKQQFKKAIDQFLIFNKCEILSTNEYGQIIKKENSSYIYMNGMKISEDESFCFSYNILKINKAIKKALNRERITIGRDSYRDRVISILKSAPLELLKSIRKNQTDEYNYVEIKILIFKLLSITPATKDMLDSNPNYAQYLRKMNKDYEIVNEKEIKAFKKEKIKTLDDFGIEFLNNYNSKSIKPNSLSLEKQKIWYESIDFIEKNNLNFNKCNIELIEDHPNALGLYSSNENKIKIVAKKLTSFENCVSTLLHEIAHSLRNNCDGTIDFENDLTNLLGKVSVKLKNSYDFKKN